VHPDLWKKATETRRVLILFGQTLPHVRGRASRTHTDGGGSENRIGETWNAMQRPLNKTLINAPCIAPNLFNSMLELVLF
jgi:hypothetical protein